MQSKWRITTVALLAAGWSRLKVSAIVAAAFEAFFAFFGLVWLIIEVATYFMTGVQETLRPYGPLLVLGALPCVAVRLLVLAWQNAPRLSVRYRVGTSNCVLELTVGDLFDVPGTLIIPTSVTFDTTTTTRLISPDSIQGQFTRAAYTACEQLDGDIESALQCKVQQRTATVEEKPFGNRTEYPVGTCVRIARSGYAAWFLALTRFHSDMTSSANLADLQKALDELWKSIRCTGEFEQLKVPVLGSGKARINATREDLAKTIIRSFTAAVIEGPFCKSLTIVIHPRDIEHAHLDFREIARFAEAQACYR